MTRIRLKGVHRVKKTLANGKVRVYHYAWRGGPLVADKDGRPLSPDEAKFAAAYAKLIDARDAPTGETMRALTALFRSSEDFKTKSPKTRRAYERYLDAIDKKFGAMPLAAVQDPRARGEFKAWRDSMATKPRTADYAWTTLARVLSFAKDRGRISVNVAERGGRLYSADRADKIWQAEDIAKMVAAAPKELQLALMLALWTGQRQGDLLRLTWFAYDGKTIKLKQRKTGARVVIPVGTPLRTVLDAMPRREGNILLNTRGRPWTEDGFRTSWGKAAGAAGIGGLTFHDLRGTAVTRLALAGCTAIQIGAITGHSTRDVEAILDAHYLGGRIELAEQAIAKLEGR
ncbi:integrase [Pseudohoeflea suaedae]|uniref:Integrase n=1 Tax=Pseudohoeflea suaedae TaxID=877384 RepID=A0A4R5PK60_9HYPH|nr:tyrosine-type recombinase/integrase [Pseudohoeflea suaedae]TDH35678.1 integrase [Pseudohoeflea suaedae]